MAKKSKKAGKRIPKEVFGVKLPKEVRRAGEALIDRAQSPDGRRAIASAAATLAAAAAATAATAAAKKPAAAPVVPGEGGTNDPQQVADAVRHAADAVLGRLFGTPRPR